MEARAQNRARKAKFKTGPDRKPITEQEIDARIQKKGAAMRPSTRKTEPQSTIQLRKAVFGGSGVRPRHIIGAATESFTGRNNFSYQCKIVALCTAGLLLAFARIEFSSSPSSAIARIGLTPP